MSHYFESGVFGNGKAAWHGLGNVTDKVLTATNILHEASLEWTLEKQPLFINNGDKHPSAFALVRSSDGRIFSDVVGKSYTIYQNHELLGLAQALTEEGVEFETAMSLKEGEIVTLLAKLQPYMILGDKFLPYLSLANYHGSGSRCVYASDIREVCYNTHSWSIGAAKLQKRIWKCRHTKGALETNAKTLEEARAILKLSAQQSQDLQQLAEELVKVKMPLSAYEQLAALLFPYEEATATTPEKEKTLIVKRNLVVDEQRSLLYKAATADDLANFRNTAWGALGAVTAYASHVSTKSDTTKDEVIRDRNERRLLDSMEKGTMEKQALEFLLQLA